LEQEQQETAQSATPSKTPGTRHRPSLATLMGGFGVLMGFATFVLVQDESHKTEKESLGIFITGLIAAALTSFVIESVRARVEEHGGHKPINTGRFLGLLILLGIFELFVTGADSLARFVFAGDQAQFLKGLFSVAAGRDLPAYSDLSSGAEMCYFAGLWIMLGCATGWAASRALPRSPLIPARRTLFTSAVSTLKGIVAVALLAFLYVCIARLAGTVYVLLVDPSRYNPTYSLLLNSRTTSSPIFGIILVIATGLATVTETIAHCGDLGGLGVIAAVFAIWVGLAVLAVNADRMAKWGALHAVLTYGFAGALLLLALGPFATNGQQFTQLMNIVLACTAIWLAPLFVLSVVAPWLRAPSHDPRVWGLVALGVAVILLVITWGRLTVTSERVLSYLAIALLVYTAFWFLRGASLREYWPFAALIVATATFEVGSGLDKLSVLNTYKSFALLQSARIESDAAHSPSAGYSTIASWREHDTIDARAAELVAGVESKWNDVDHEDIAVESSAMSKNIDAQRTILINARLDRLCGNTGSEWLDALHKDFNLICKQEQTRLIASPTGEPTAPPALRDSTPHPGTILLPLVREIEERNLARLATEARSGRNEEDVALSLIASPNAPSAPRPPIQPHLATDSSAASAQAETEMDLLRKFQWLAPNSGAMTALARQARERLPEPDRDLSATGTVALLDPAAQRSAEERGWLALSIMARSAPPGPAAIAWEDNPSLQKKLRAELPVGLSLDQIDDFWYWRLLELEGFREVASSTTPGSWNAGTHEPVELLRAKHTLLALGFASAQLSLLGNEAKRGGNFQLDRRSVRYLELALGACFAFWATAGLLAVSAKQTHSVE
jgi:hypothetical protein